MSHWCVQHNCPSSICGGTHREFSEEQIRRAAPLVAAELRKLAVAIRAKGEDMHPHHPADMLEERADELDPP